jgi:hypothetical protein
MNSLNTIFQNVLTQDLQDSLKVLIDSELSRRTVIDISRDPDGYSGELDSSDFIRVEDGRIQLELFPLPKNIEKEFSKSISSVYGKHSLIGSVYCEYNTKYGLMNLPMHMDRNKDNLCFDYQILSNVSWPLIIEDSDYTLEDNSAITMRPKIQNHGRKNVEFEDGSFVKMLFTFWSKRGAPQ